MAQPTVYIHFHTYENSNPLAEVFSSFATDAGGLLVSHLVDEEDVETNIALVNTVQAALHVIQETEDTRVFFSYFEETERVVAIAFAARFPDRMTAGPLFERNGEENLILTFKRTIEEMAKENK